MEVGERKKKKKQRSKIHGSPEDLTQKHPTKPEALDFHVVENSSGDMDNEPMKKKKKEKEAVSQQTSPGVSIAGNTPVDQVAEVGERKRKKKRWSKIGGSLEDLIRKHPTKLEASDFNVAENSDGGLHNKPKKKKKKEAVSQQTSPGVSIAGNTPVDQVAEVGERKRKKKQRSTIGGSLEDLTRKHPTKREASDFHVAENSDGGLHDKPKKKKKKEKEVVSQETSSGVSIAGNTPVDQVGEVGDRKRKKKQLSEIDGSPEDLTQKHPKRRKTSDFHVGEKSDGGLENQPKKKKKKKKEVVSQETNPDVSIIGNTPVDQKMKPETVLTTPVDQRTKPEIALTTPETTLPLSSERGGTGTGSIQPIVGQMFRHQLAKAWSLHPRGKFLDEVLERLSRAIELAKHTKGQVRDKIWLKQKFSVGINDVTRTLERMPTALDKANMNDVSDIEHLKNVQETLQRFPASQDSHLEDKDPEKQIARNLGKPERVVQLQAVLVAPDCRPKALTSHIPSLASSRGVPLLYISDHGKGSLRLGQLLMLRTTTTIGIKVGESPINKTIQDILDDWSTRVHKK